uniref:Uncharacterized protein n=1 Tax=Setaria viridis TaxID=4556 RepID=A0A4U6SVP5_SETVI|nr:hypothetical protein SEVIR_9G194350v2 [Setaria viridis]
MSSGETIPIVSIAVWGQIAPSRVTSERTVVEACLQQLKDLGYFVPHLSYFRIKQFEERESNVLVTAERLYRLNQHDIDLFGTTNAATSFRAILAQVLDALNLTYMGGNPIFTRD